MKVMYKQILYYRCVKLVPYICLKAACLTYKSRLSAQLHWTLDDIFHSERYALVELNKYYAGGFFKMHIWVTLQTHDAV